LVVGCVRSGTTMLRDVLRMHPNLACPEETHFFRWCDPYGTDPMLRTLINNAVLKRHREIDKITEEEFKDILNRATSRADLYGKYMALFMSRNKPTATRWFDKTPQNIYGAMLAATTMPRAKFVHIVRDPRNVVASLRIGRIVKVEGLVGACNYWNEAVSIVAGLKRAYPSRVFELRYEDFVNEPMKELSQLLAFLNEPFEPQWFTKVNTRNSDHTDEGVLKEEEMSTVRKLCSPGMIRYGYEAKQAEGASSEAEGPFA
jgi:disulfide oxidoreductase YuzD